MMKNSTSHPVRQLEATALYCARGERDILQNISFSVQSGQALLLRGPNGAGKSTLLMCLAGFLPLTAGEINWHGRDAETRPGEDVHFLGHRTAVKSGLTVAQNLQFWADINGGDTNLIPAALESARLDHAADLDAGYLSAGQTKRLALVRLLIAPRPVWLLDEPSAALDAQGDEWLAQLLDYHLDKGGLIIAATHLDLGMKNPERLKTLQLGTAL